VAEKELQRRNQRESLRKYFLGDDPKEKKKKDSGFLSSIGNIFTFGCANTD